MARWKGEDALGAKRRRMPRVAQIKRSEAAGKARSFNTARTVLAKLTKPRSDNPAGRRRTSQRNCEHIEGRRQLSAVSGRSQGDPNRMPWCTPYTEAIARHDGDSPSLDVGREFGAIPGHGQR